MTSPAITYRLNATLYAEDVQRLFQAAPWATARTLEEIETMLEHTPLDISAWHDGQLVGFARVLTDDVYRAFLEDVVVARAYQRQGIGSDMIAQLMGRLAHVEELVLRCEPHLVSFYERFGFVSDGGRYMRR
jgi:predicted GNAT family N-acyltransferase